MPRGAPDDSDVLKFGIVCRLDDMAELAARLGSPMKYHRFGDVVYYDDFEMGRGGWDFSSVMPTGSIRLDTEYSLSGGISLRLDTGDGAPSIVYVDHENAPIQTDKIGFHIAFQMDTKDSWIEFSIGVYDGTSGYDFTIRYGRLAQTLQYLKPVAGRTQFAEVGMLGYGISLFHHAKLVIDYANREYDTFYLNQHKYDLSDCLPYTWTNETDPQIVVRVHLQEATERPAIISIDDLVITQNEV